MISEKALFDSLYEKDTGLAAAIHAYKRSNVAASRILMADIKAQFVKAANGDTSSFQERHGDRLYSAMMDSLSRVCYTLKDVLPAQGRNFQAIISSLESDTQSFVTFFSALNDYAVSVLKPVGVRKSFDNALTVALQTWKPWLTGHHMPDQGKYKGNALASIRSGTSSPRRAAIVPGKSPLLKSPMPPPSVRSGSTFNRKPLSNASVMSDLTDAEYSSSNSAEMVTQRRNQAFIDQFGLDALRKRQYECLYGPLGFLAQLYAYHSKQVPAASMSSKDYLQHQRAMHRLSNLILSAVNEVPKNVKMSDTVEAPYQALDASVQNVCLMLHDSFIELRNAHCLTEAIPVHYRSQFEPFMRRAIEKIPGFIDLCAALNDSLIKMCPEEFKVPFSKKMAEGLEQWRKKLLTPVAPTAPHSAMPRTGFQRRGKPSENEKQLLQQLTAVQQENASLVERLAQAMVPAPAVIAGNAEQVLQPIIEVESPLQVSGIKRLLSVYEGEPSLATFNATGDFVFNYAALDEIINSVFSAADAVDLLSYKKHQANDYELVRYLGNFNGGFLGYARQHSSDIKNIKFMKEFSAAFSAWQQRYHLQIKAYLARAPQVVKAVVETVDLGVESSEETVVPDSIAVVEENFNHFTELYQANEGRLSIIRFDDEDKFFVDYDQLQQYVDNLSIQSGLKEKFKESVRAVENEFKITQDIAECLNAIRKKLIAIFKPYLRVYEQSGDSKKARDIETNFWVEITKLRLAWDEKYQEPLKKYSYVDRNNLEKSVMTNSQKMLRKPSLTNLANVDFEEVSKGFSAQRRKSLRVEQQEQIETIAQQINDLYQADLAGERSIFYFIEDKFSIDEPRFEKLIDSLVQDPMDAIALKEKMSAYKVSLDQDRKLDDYLQAIEALLKTTITPRLLDVAVIDKLWMQFEIHNSRWKQHYREQRSHYINKRRGSVIAKADTIDTDISAARRKKIMLEEALGSLFKPSIVAKAVLPSIIDFNGQGNLIFDQARLRDVVCLLNVSEQQVTALLDDFVEAHYAMEFSRDVQEVVSGLTQAILTLVNNNAEKLGFDALVASELAANVIRNEKVWLHGHQATLLMHSFFEQEDHSIGVDDIILDKALALLMPKKDDQLILKNDILSTNGNDPLVFLDRCQQYIVNAINKLTFSVDETSLKKTALTEAYNTAFSQLKTHCPPVLYSACREVPVAATQHGETSVEDRNHLPIDHQHEVDGHTLHALEHGKSKEVHQEG